MLRWGEVLVISEHCVAGCEHFAHCGDEGAFVRFASGSEGFAESGELGLGLEDAGGRGHAKGVAAVAGPMPCIPCSRAARAVLACCPSERANWRILRSGARATFCPLPQAAMSNPCPVPPDAPTSR